MKVGDLIEIHTGEKALVLELEMLYPRHPRSPIRNLVVHWVDHPPSHAFGDKKSKVSAFSAKVISHAKK